MSNEILSSRLQTELRVHLLHGILVEIDTYGDQHVTPTKSIGQPKSPTLVSSGILILPPLKELKELLRPPLLKEAHERATDSLHLVTWHLGDLAITVDEAACDLLELQVTSHVGVDEDLGQLARGDDELWDKVNGVVAVASKLSWGRLIWPELAVELL